MTGKPSPGEHAAALAGLLIAFLAVTLTVATAAGAGRTDAAAASGLPVHASALPTLRPDLTAQVRVTAHPAAPAAAAAPAGPAFPFPSSQPDLPVHSEAAILVDVSTGRVIWSQNAHARHATASLGKIFTVMVALDHASLDTVVTVPPGGEDDDPTHSVMGLTAGDRITVRDLVSGIWLASGDDAAETLAATLVPRGQFIAEMNAKAQMLGLADTHLGNPSGLDAPDEYSSPYDLAVATVWLETHYPQAYALAGQTLVPLPANSWRARDMTLKTLNRMLDDFPGMNHGYPGATGLKTGYTDDAGGCVVATAERSGHKLVAVVMHSDYFFSDAGTLLDYGWTLPF